MNSRNGFLERLKLLDCGQGTTQDMLYVGWCLLHGVETIQDKSAGLKWYLAAASSGNTEAMIRLAEMYEVGKLVDTNCLEAEKWYEAALKDTSSFMGHYARALSYDFGSDCNKSDPNKALYHYKQASGKGHIVSKLQFARILRTGKFGKSKIIYGWFVSFSAFCQMTWIILRREETPRLWDSQRWVPVSLQKLSEGTRFEYQQYKVR